MKKRGMFCMVLMTVLLIVQGCSDVIEDDVTITVGGWARDRVESSYTVPGDPDKKKKSYKYEVVIEDWDYDVEAFLMRAATGQLPTIYDVAYTDMERIKNSGYGTDITDYLEKGYTDFLDGRILELISKDGRIYAIPSQVYVMGMLFNAELFREAGLQRLDGSYVLPQTLDELVEIAKIIRDRTGASGFLLPVDGNTGGWVFSNIAWEFGVEFIIKDKEGNWKANFDTPECVKALQWVKELKWKHDILPENPFTNQEQSWALLASGQSAMLMDDPYRSINKIITDYGIQKDDIGVFTLPAGPEGRIALMGGALLCINNTATEEELDAAFHLLEEVVLPSLSLDEKKEEIEEEFKEMSEQNQFIGVKTLNMWDSCEESVFRNSLIEKYQNVDSNLFADYNACLYSEEVEIRLEEPACCQDLYRILTQCVRAVLEDENADPEELIHDAAVEFQSEYLDKIN